jgi:hypothetical protein
VNLTAWKAGTWRTNAWRAGAWRSADGEWAGPTGTLVKTLAPGKRPRPRDEDEALLLLLMR